MARAKQLTISHENRPGMLAHIVQVLGDAKVNILACLTTTSGSEGQTHLIVDHTDNAKKAFARVDLRYSEADVLQIELPNMPGALAKFASKLADKDINITFGYQTSTKGSRKATLVLAVSDLEKAAGIR